MLNVSEILEEIEKLEKCDCTTQEVCKKLAILYIVKDHYKLDDEKINSRSTNTIGNSTMSAPSMMVK